MDGQNNPPSIAADCDNAASKREATAAADGEAAAAASPSQKTELTAREVIARIALVFSRLGPAGPLALVAVSTPAISGFLLLASIPWITPWLRAHQELGQVLYVSVYSLLGGLSLMPTYAHAVLGGWTFGFKSGFPLAMAAFTAAAMLGYAIGRLASRDRVLEMVREHPKSRKIHDMLLGKSFARSLVIITLLRIPPSSPFAVTNLTLAAVRANPIAYSLGTIIGIAPRTAVVAYGAASLVPEHPSKWALVVGLLILVLGMIGFIANQALAKVSQQGAVKSSTAGAALDGSKAE